VVLLSEGELKYASIRYGRIGNLNAVKVLARNEERKPSMMWKMQK